MGNGKHGKHHRERRKTFKNLLLILGCFPCFPLRFRQEIKYVILSGDTWKSISLTARTLPASVHGNPGVPEDLFYDPGSLKIIFDDSGVPEDHV